jgi:hypothetical protein
MCFSAKVRSFWEQNASHLHILSLFIGTRNLLPIPEAAAPFLTFMDTALA